MRLIVVAVAVFLVVPGEANAQAPTGPTLFAPPAAKVAGTNGFTVYVFPPNRYSRTSNRVSLMARRGGSWAVYSATGKVTRNSMQVDLKGFGAVDLRFDPSGRSRQIEQVGGCGVTLPTRVGVFWGEVSFKGERSYTRVDAARARSTAPPETSPVCTGVQGPIPGSGASLTGRNFSSPAAASYGGFKSGPDAPSGAVAFTNNQRGNPNIYRAVAKAAPSGAFTYSRDGASLEPGPPFSGRADYVVSGVCPDVTAASGTLTVSFPGTSPISLLGQEFDYTLADFSYVPTPDPGNPPPACPG